MNAVFVIYAKAKAILATRIHIALGLARIDNWVDHIHVSQQDTSAATESTDALTRSEIGLFILSEEAVKSRKCQRQWEAILNQGKRLIVAIAEPFPPDDVPDRLWDRRIPYIDLSADLNEGLAELVRAVARETSS
jgi:hypothetical protein